MYNHH